MRSPFALTVVALRAGALVVSAVFVIALALQLLANPLADQVAMVGVLVLIATPAAALAATAIENRGVERATTLLALAVLAVLGVAIAVAIYVAP
jgi:hypothetical protein